LVIWLLDGLHGQSIIALCQFKSNTGHGGGCAMLDGQDDAVVGVAAEIEVRIAPGVELRRSAQSLTGADGAGSLPGMMDDRDGDGVTTLQVTQEGEQRRDLAADILIDAAQAHERIEDERPRLQAGDGLIETCAVGREIEAQTGHGDHLDVEFSETDASGGADALEAAADDVERVLLGIKQHATRAVVFSYEGECLAGVRNTHGCHGGQEGPAGQGGRSFPGVAGRRRGSGLGRDHCLRQWHTHPTGNTAIALAVTIKR
jgi:hypothetical protein